MNQHEQRIRQALEDFCRDYTGREAGWRVETWLHPVVRSVNTVTVVPEFASVEFTDRIVLIDRYLRAHLATEEYRHLGVKAGVTPDEYDKGDWRPYEADMVLVER